MEDFRIRKLAEIYKRGIKESVLVAEICDEVLDRSGRLLGEVRETAQHIAQAELLVCHDCNMNLDRDKYCPRCGEYKSATRLTT